MLMESATRCDRVTLLKRVKSEQEPKLTSDSDESDSDESHSVKYRGDFFEKYKAREEADKVYREKCRGLSPYDAIPRPQKSQLCSTSFVSPLIITEEYFLVLQRLSKLALDYYKEVSGASFEFHGIVKCTFNFTIFVCWCSSYHLL
ncbi:hypothetical protein P8452_44240 [Trifolium repens]|nr:hypothetical protein P8452_44240 [Trifolium repens]